MSRFFIMFISVVFYINSLGQSTSVLESNSSSVILRIEPKYKVSDININGTIYKQIYCDDSYTDAIPGMPQLPKLSFNLAVPSETGNITRITASSFKEISGKILPAPKYNSSSGEGFYVYEESDDYYKPIETETVNFGEFGYIRQEAVQQIIVEPVIFNPSSKTIKLAEYLIVEVKFNTPLIYKGKSGNFAERQGVLNNEYGSSVSENNYFGIRKKQSVLFSGNWYKFTVASEGFYKITKQMLPQYGIDSDVDPRTIRIFNNGGSPLSEKLTDPYPAGPNEIAIMVVGEEDGKFDDDDYILFYGRNIKFWQYNETSRRITRNRNPFSDNNYYFITSGSAAGKRINGKPSSASTATLIQNTTKAFISHEIDRLNIAGFGRLWVGEEFTSQSPSAVFVNKLHDRVAETPVLYTVNFANSSAKSAGVSFYEGTTRLDSIRMNGYEGTSHFFGSEVYRGWAYHNALTENRSQFKINYNPSGTVGGGYLDFFDIEYTRTLKALNDSLIFYGGGVNGFIEYRMTNFSSTDKIKVFDVSNFSEVKLITGEFKSGGECRFTSEESAGSYSKYFAVSIDKTGIPGAGVKINNSDLTGISEGFRYVIITDRSFASPAEKLRKYRNDEAPEKISAGVFFTDDIYHNFSSGMVDPTAIRNFMNHAYLTWQVKPEYILLLGKGTYDYCNRLKIGDNIVPSYQSAGSSLDDYISLVTDDFYARFDGSDNFLDAALGRIPAATIQQAEVAINKIIKYETSSSTGLWKTRLSFLADDNIVPSGIDGIQHTKQTEELINFVPDFFSTEKIYLALHPTVQTAFGRRKPGVTDALLNSINSGIIMLNFTGHGNPNIWTDEKVLERTVHIPQFRNDNYFLLTAATCDFSRYDIPGLFSGGENFLLLENAGAIAVFSAARVVRPEPNDRLNKSFYNTIFINLVNGDNKPSGYSYMIAKNLNMNDNTRRFHLFGDPFLKIKFPSLAAYIDSVNSKTVTETVNLQALGKASLKGGVSADSTFNGEAFVTVFDSRKSLIISELDNLNVTLDGSIIFKGKSSVSDGKFSTEFVVPKDISYENKNGKITAYIYNKDYDALTANKNIIVGGMDTTAVNDNKGPDIEILFDDLKNGSANLVKKDFDLLVKLNDETGLNTSNSGIGHNMTAVIDGNEMNAVDLSKYFISDLDSGGKSGVVSYRINNMKSGMHKVKISAWDVFNNNTTSENTFYVTESEVLEIKDIYNYPNPFETTTHFTFQHNYESPVDVKLRIYTVSGRMIYDTDEKFISDRFVRIFWNGKDNDGDNIANGTYLYKIVVSTSDGKYTSSFLGKIAKID